MCASFVSLLTGWASRVVAAVCLVHVCVQHTDVMAEAAKEVLCPPVQVAVEMANVTGGRLYRAQASS